MDPAGILSESVQFLSRPPGYTHTPYKKKNMIKDKSILIRFQASIVLINNNLFMVSMCLLSYGCIQEVTKQLREV
mgnify:FL=1